MIWDFQSSVDFATSVFATSCFDCELDHDVVQLLMHSSFSMCSYFTSLSDSTLS